MATISLQQRESPDAVEKVVDVAVGQGRHGEADVLDDLHVRPPIRTPQPDRTRDICETPTIVSMPPVIIGCTSTSTGAPFGTACATAVAISSNAALTAAASGRRNRTAPMSVLWTPEAMRAFAATGYPRTSASAAASAAGRTRTRAGHQRKAIRIEHALHLIVGQPAVAPLRQRCTTAAPRSVRLHVVEGPVESRHPVAPSRVIRHCDERPDGVFDEAEHGEPLPGARDHPVGRIAHEADEYRLVGCTRPAL